MTDQSSISVTQQLDVYGFVNEQLGLGSAVGAVYPKLPSVDQAIDDLTLALARHVLKVAMPEIVASPRDKWLQAAYGMIAENHPPLPIGYSTEINVDRLMRWLDSKCERIFIGFLPLLDMSGVRDARRVAEWVNSVSRLPTIVVHGTEDVAPPKRAAFKSKLEESLALRLEQDVELRGLFEPNLLVTTVFQTRPCVDLLWRSGRMIVEVDSYRYHSNPDRFTGDRQRDYETGATGYVTLRLTDQEIVSDLSLAVQKIRRYVLLRKKLFHV